MKLLSYSLSTFDVGSLAWSAHLGRRIWSPRVFAWRNFLRRPPDIVWQPSCPLLITQPRYYSFASLGSSVGGTLRFNVTNISDKVVYSYYCRWYSPDPTGNGAYGAPANEQDGGLQPGQSIEGATSASHYHKITLTIDFVQFADGSTWFSNAAETIVKPAGVKAGMKAAGHYLLTVLNHNGMAEIIKVLPYIQAKISEGEFPAEAELNGIFGFYCGVNNAAMQIEKLFRENNHEKIIALLQSLAKGGNI